VDKSYVVHHECMNVVEVLRAERERTLAQLESLAADLADIKASTDGVATDDEHDPEGATIAFERSRVDALLTQARDHLLDIAAAQQRVAAKTYGICERCGNPISSGRLTARPTAATCIGCASAS
jgi:DnaK suppressor protein